MEVGVIFAGPLAGNLMAAEGIAVEGFCGTDLVTVCAVIVVLYSVLAVSAAAGYLVSCVLDLLRERMVSKRAVGEGLRSGFAAHFTALVIQSLRGAGCPLRQARINGVLYSEPALCQLTVSFAADGTGCLSLAGSCTAGTGCLVLFVGTAGNGTLVEVGIIFAGPLAGNLMVAEGIAVEGFCGADRVAVRAVIVVLHSVLAVSAAAGYLVGCVLDLLGKGVRQGCAIFLLAGSAFRLLGTGGCAAGAGGFVLFVGTAGNSTLMEVLFVFRCPLVGNLMAAEGGAVEGLIFADRVAVQAVIVVLHSVLAVSATAGYLMGCIFNFLCERVVCRLAVGESLRSGFAAHFTAQIILCRGDTGCRPGQTLINGVLYREPALCQLTVSFAAGGTGCLSLAGGGAAGTGCLVLFVGTAGNGTLVEVGIIFAGPLVRNLVVTIGRAVEGLIFADRIAIRTVIVVLF